jgi:hypothetical protein
LTLINYIICGNVEFLKIFSSKEDILKESKIILFEIFRNILIFNIKK